MTFLRETPKDLRDGVIEAAARLGIADRQVEKDYWVTEVLRRLVRDFDGTFLFKGGTSLSKAYRIVERFSEDIDLLLLSEEGQETEALLDGVQTAAEGVLGHGAEIDRDPAVGLARRMLVEYDMLPDLPKAKGMRRQIVVEPGIRGGPKPSERKIIISLLGDVLGDGSYEDLTPFDLDVLHPARTMVEKLFAVDAIGAKLLADPLRKLSDTEARHFYDLYFLWDEEKSQALSWLSEGSNHDDVVTECLEVSARWYNGSVVPDGGFANSACFVNPDLTQRLEDGYRRMLEAVCYPLAARPSFEDVCRRARGLAGTI